MKVIVRPETLAVTGCNAIGDIHCELSRGVRFPATDWNDFVVVVLGWWIAQVLPLRCGFEGEAELRFMDGPFRIRIVNHGYEAGIECFSGRCSVFLDRCDIGGFYQSLMDAALRTAAFCRRNGLVTADLKILEDLIEQGKSDD